MHRKTLLAVLLTVLTAALAWGIWAGPGGDPGYATNRTARPQGEPPAAEEQQGPPAIAAPASDLSWRDCTTRVFGDADLPPVPGIQLDCASFDADLDPLGGTTGTVNIGAVRARTTATPEDAGPLVFTTGTDLASSRQLPVWLTRAGADVLAVRPVVAVDRRGIGMSSPATCLDSFDRRELADQAQFEPGDDPVANLNKIAITATTNCGDAVAQANIAYDNAHAAEDLEALRSRWDVPGLAVLGIGNGAQVALAYAASHPTKLARLILDSPVTLGVAAEALAEQRVKGQQAALDAFAQQCAAMHCALGPDPKGAISALLADARARRGPGGISTAALTHAITTALGFPVADPARSTTALADALAAAQRGDTNPLTGLSNRAAALRGSDGQFINECSDALDRPTPDRVRELAVEWGKQYPQFGTVGALDMVRCLPWATPTPTSPPEKIDVGVLLLGVEPGDAIVGSGVAATAATVLNAEAANKRVIWQGVGHGAAIYSACAVPPLIGYLDSGELPDSDTFCPA